MKLKLDIDTINIPEEVEKYIRENCDIQDSLEIVTHCTEAYDFIMEWAYEIAAEKYVDKIAPKEIAKFIISFTTESIPSSGGYPVEN